MAVTQNTYTGNGSTVLYSFTFPYLETTDIKVSVNGSTTTAYTLANATTIQFNTAPANGAAIRIYRQTDDSALAATFYPGSAIRSSDLNDNFTQNLYVTQESSNSAAAATTTANTALTNSTTAINTANASTATANTALSNSQTALTQSASAVSTANSASSSASSAVSTANSAAADAATALTQSSAAVATANTSASNAATALSNSQTALTQSASALSASAAATSTANTAAANAASAVSTANTASSNAAAALNAVANSVQYQLVAAVANIPASPSNGDAIEIANSTGIESFSPLANRPAGFVGDTGLSVRMQYSSAGSTWNWLNYFSNDSDTRYLKKSGGTLTGALTLNADPTQNLQAATKQYVDNVANAGGLPLTGGTMTGQILGDNSTSPTTPGYAFDGDPNTGMYRPGADELALVTGGTARLTIDPAGGVAITNGLNVGGQTAVVTNDARLSNTRTPTDGTVTDAKVAANAAIAGSKIQAASTSNAGAVQLTDSTSSTSTTTAATPNAVKSAYDLANAALPKAGGALTGDVTLNAQSDLRFADADSSNWVALQGPATVSSNVTWTLPSADGTSGQVLSTNGSGTLSWATAAAGGASVTTSDTPPATPNDGDLWYDSVGGRTYVYYQDPNGSQWVDASPQGGGGSKIEAGNTKAEVTDTGTDGAFVVTTEGVQRFRIAPTGTVALNTGNRLGFGGLYDNPASHYIEYSSTINGLWLNGSAAITLDAGGAEQARVSGRGLDVIGVLAPNYTPQVATDLGKLNVSPATATGTAMMIASYNNFKAISFIRDAAAIGYERGSITVNNSSTAYNTSSDYRLKENIIPLTGATERLKKLPVRRFNFIVDPGRTVDGFIAHEAQAVVPEAVHGIKDEVDADGNPVYQGIDQSKLVPLLTAALQEAVARIEAQDTTIASLEARLTALEGGN